MAKFALPVSRTSGVEDVAEELDLNAVTIRRDIKDGAPHTRTSKKLLLNVSEYSAWRTARGRTGERGRPEFIAKSKPMETAKLRTENARAEKYEIEVAQLRGQLVSREEVKRDYIARITTAKNKFIGLGASIVPHLQGRDAAEQQSMIDARVHEILNELAGK